MRLGKLQCTLDDVIGLVPMLLLVVGFTVGSIANAQTSDGYSSAEVVPPLVIDITSFSVIGENPLTAKTTQTILKPYLGSGKSIADIESAVKRLEEKLRKEGYSFYRVEVSSQELVGGEIELTVQRYRIGQIEVTGNRYYNEQNILASLPQLTEGASPSTASMSRSLRVANQNSGKRTLLQLQSSPTPNVLDASIQIVDQKPMVLSAWVNNTGTEMSGDYRVGAGFEHRNLFNRDHIVNLSFITSPESFDSVQQTALTYQLPLYQLGGKLNLIAVKSDIDTGTVAGVFEVAGRGEVLGLGYTHVLPSIGNYRHQVTAQLTDKLFENDIVFSGEQVGPNVRSRPLSLSYQSSWRTKNLALAGSVGYVKNMNGGRFNNQTNYALSRSGARSDWETYAADFSLQYTMAKWLFSGAINYTGSSYRLITGEQFALGGVSSIRGMEERELNGDKGYRLVVQVWTPLIKNLLRPVLFFDVGRARINQAEVDELADESVASFGLSFYINPSPKLNLSISLAHLFDGIDAEQAVTSGLSQDGDNKIHFNLAYRF